MTAAKILEYFITISLINLCILICESNGQENPIPLTINDAWRMALSGDPGLAARDHQIAKDELDITRAISPFRPKFGFSSSYSRSSLENDIEFLNPLNGTTNVISLFPENRYNLGLSLTHNVFSFGRRRSLKRAAQTAVEISRLEKEEYRRLIFDKVTGVFLLSLLARDNLHVNKENIQRAERKLEIVKSRMSQGLASEYDSVKAELLLSKYQSDLINAQRDYKGALISLKSLINRREANLVMPIGDLDSLDLSVPVASSIMPDENLEVRRLDYLATVRRNQLDFQRKRFLPDIAYFARYEWQNGYQPDINKLEDYWTLGLTLNLSLFDGGERRSAVRIERYELKRISSLRADLLLVIKAGIEAALSDMDSAEKGIAVSRRRLDLARKGLAIAEARYKEGLLSISDLIDIELDNAEAEIGLNFSLYRLAMARLGLKKAAGYYPELYADQIPDFDR